MRACPYAREAGTSKIDVPASIGTDRTVFDVCSHFVRKHCNSSGSYLRRNGYTKLTNKMQTYVANVEDGFIEAGTSISKS